MSKSAEFTYPRGVGLSAFAIAAIFVASLPAQARTVYDAGKALKVNCISGTYANPYTDANGGVWSYHTSSAVAPFNGLTLVGEFPDYVARSLMIIMK